METVVIKVYTEVALEYYTVGGACEPNKYAS